MIRYSYTYQYLHAYCSNSHSILGPVGAVKKRNKSRIVCIGLLRTKQYKQQSTSSIHNVANFVFITFSRLLNALDDFLGAEVRPEKSEGSKCLCGPLTNGSARDDEQRSPVKCQQPSFVYRVSNRLCAIWQKHRTLKFAEVCLTHHVISSLAVKTQSINTPKGMPRYYPQQHADSAYLRTSSEMNTKQ